VTVRVGVIGAGMIGQDHIRRLTKVVTGAEVVAVTDIDAARAADLIVQSDVDAVLVTSWGPTHAEHVLAAIAAGYREMKKVIDGGEIGTPLMVHCAHRNPSVPESYRSAMAAQDTAVHEIDVLRWLLDDEIVSAQVLTPRRTSKRFGHLQDPQIMLFETAAGVRIDLEVFVNCQYGYDIQCETVGEDGLVRLPDPARTTVRTGGVSRGSVPQDWRERFADAFDVEFQEWIDTVAAGAEPTGPSSWDGYAATVITDATVEALDTGRVIGVAMKDRPAFYTGGSR
jgi:myo-inositol 2-dehydrogenase/D-chiro-inositol 1-dehydrogenase